MEVEVEVEVPMLDYRLAVNREKGYKENDQEKQGHRRQNGSIAALSIFFSSCWRRGGSLFIPSRYGHIDNRRV